MSRRESAVAQRPSSGGSSGERIRVPDRLSLVWATGAVAGCLVLLRLLTWFHPLHPAEIALTAGDFRTALLLAESELKKDSKSSQALLVAGFAAQGMQRQDVAARYFARASEEADFNDIHVLMAQAGQAMTMARAESAEQALRRVLELVPDHREANDQLIFLLVLEGRVREAQDVILRVLQSGRVDWNHLIVAGSSKTELSDSDRFAAACLQADPGNPLPLLPEARQHLRLHNVQQARELVERITRRHPRLLEAQGLLGVILAESGDSTGFLEWNRQLPSDADDNPGVWFGRGLWAMRVGQKEGAVRCFAEALLRQPSLVAVNHQLSQALAAIHEQTLAAELGERTRMLTRVEFLIRQLVNPPENDQLHEIVNLMVATGRHWEAAAWCQIAFVRNPSERWPFQIQSELRPHLAACRALTVDSANPARTHDLTRYPLPNWQPGLDPTPEGDNSNPGASRVTFSEESSSAGIRFTYHNGAVSESESMFELDGGGIAILDYDGDHWPDIYLTQGGRLPPEATPRADPDALFRNLGNGQFEEVTLPSRLGDLAYSQGVTAGDFDNDGFQDLYVANIGPNALYRNNGDGTFAEVPSEAGCAGNEWTSSCVMVDVNGDSLPDLFAVNYLGGDALRTRLCRRDTAIRCAPDQFPAEQDRLYLNLGDGRFQDVTREAGIVDLDGRGLGIIAADFDDSHRISLFVGNDMSRNFLFANETTVRGLAPRFTERALLRGIAVDARGFPKASMGIAAGDANGDGRLDLFITNFYRESNNLYLHQADHSFADATRLAGLSESGVYMLGWGTQFLDGELDGSPDLIITNGHVHSPSDPKVPYRMAPQYCRNTGGGRFVELPAATLGEYFQGKYLGRSLARLDWNRDGLEEVCVSHLDTTAALLLNRTADRGHHIAFRLVGIGRSHDPTGAGSDRDAIGASVLVVAGGRNWRRQLVAGDGYQASNQRQLVFGIGECERVERVEVDWPSGQRQIFSSLPADREFVLVEGRSAASEITVNRR